jgi:hypothetical protein
VSISSEEVQLVLELEAMMVRLFRRSNSPAFMAIVGQFVWVFQLTSGVALGAWLGALGFPLAAAARRLRLPGRCVRLRLAWSEFL